MLVEPQHRTGPIKAQNDRFLSAETFNIITKELSDMAMVESLQKAIDYMEEHLLDNITIQDIANQAHLSPYHFQRIFLILTEVTVGEYLRRRRLTLSAQELMSTDFKIIDLALKYGYDTPEAFSKAFRKQHGISPREARKGLTGLQSYNRLQIQVQLKGVESMKYRIVEREEFKVVGVKKDVPCSNESLPQANIIPQFWAESSQNGTIQKLASLINGEIKGLLGVTTDYDNSNQQIEYWIGVETSSQTPSPYSETVIPAAKWVVFEVNGPVQTEMPKAWKQIYGEWFPSNGYEPQDIPPLEVYLDDDPSQPDSSNEIWVAIK